MMKKTILPCWVFEFLRLHAKSGVRAVKKRGGRLSLESLKPRMLLAADVPSCLDLPAIEAVVSEVASGCDDLRGASLFTGDDDGDSFPQPNDVLLIPDAANVDDEMALIVGDATDRNLVGWSTHSDGSQAMAHLAATTPTSSFPVLDREREPSPRFPDFLLPPPFLPPPLTPEEKEFGNPFLPPTDIEDFDINPDEVFPGDLETLPQAPPITPVPLDWPEIEIDLDNFLPPRPLEPDYLPPTPYPLPYPYPLPLPHWPEPHPTNPPGYA